MQTPNPPRPEPRRQTPAFAGGPVHIPGNNERQLLARIAQLEAVALRKCNGPLHYCGNILWAHDGNHDSFFQRLYDSAYGTTWFGAEAMLDAAGRKWVRHYEAVVDDFGDLVEVPA